MPTEETAHVEVVEAEAKVIYPAHAIVCSSSPSRPCGVVCARWELLHEILFAPDIPPCSNSWQCRIESRPSCGIWSMIQLSDFQQSKVHLNVWWNFGILQLQSVERQLLPLPFLEKISLQSSKPRQCIHLMTSPWRSKGPLHNYLSWQYLGAQCFLTVSSITTTTGKWPKQGLPNERHPSPLLMSSRILTAGPLQTPATT